MHSPPRAAWICDSTILSFYLEDGIKHFGIGDAEAVDYIEVTWTSGYAKRVDNPTPNKYHPISGDWQGGPSRSSLP